MRKLTTEQFIERSTKIHSGKYLYEKSVYIGHSKKIIITCPIHGDFEQHAGSHMKGVGCSICANNKKYTTEEFKNNAINVHGQKYNYDMVEYQNVFKKVKIFCPIDDHGYFMQSPKSHLDGAGCPICANRKDLDQESFIKKSLKLHSGKYSYENVKFINRNTFVDITCPIHGIFSQRPSNHLSGNGCQKCKLVDIGLFHRGTTETFILKAKKVHGDKYIYDEQCNYIHQFEKVKIYCPVENHGYFEQQPKEHINGTGCPKCRRSKAEHKISKLLSDNNIKNENQFSFFDCRNKYPLPFDFYIEVDNRFGLVEYHGQQHYYSVDFFGGQEAFEYRKHNDELKKEYCENNNIPLLIIPYKQFKNLNRLIMEYVEYIKINGKQL